MQFFEKHLIGIIFLSIAIGLTGLIAYQFLFIRFNGKHVPAPDIPRAQQTLGQGPALRFAVIGDSTSIGQGSDYDDSIAIKSAKYLARTHTVTVQNFGVSGATTRQVLDDQAAAAVTFSPDVILIATGANDVTKFTPSAEVEQSIRTIITTLRSANPDIQIIMTGAPAVGSAVRFAWPTTVLADYRVDKVNQIFDRVAADTDTIRVRIAEETKALFKNNPQLFAPDNFHPNAAGYAVWQPLIDEALSR